MSQKVKEKLADSWHTISLYNGSSIENSFVKKDSNKRHSEGKSVTDVYTNCLKDVW